jgi:hypothetical protein
MKTFASHSFAFDECAAQLDAFDDLLRSKADLGERDDILPFFKKNTQLASFISTYVPDIANPDRIATEYDIFGDFACDLAIGEELSFGGVRGCQAKQLVCHCGRESNA